MPKSLYILLAVVLVNCTPSPKGQQKKLTASEFLSKSNEKIMAETYSASLASWIQQNFITDDTTKISAEYNARYAQIATEMATESKSYKSSDSKEQRMLDLLAQGLTVPSPKDPKLNKQSADLQSELSSLYGSGKYCKDSNNCQSLVELEKTIAKSRNPDELLDAWQGWRTIALPMKDKFQRTVEIGNQGAKELGYQDMADLWRSKYDMPAKDFEAELDRIWQEVKPFYEQLHCFVRGKLNKKYGDSVVPLDQAIPAHLLGNMWAQSWDNIGDIVGLNPNNSVDITSLLEKNKYDSKKMVETAENFFVSLGMPKLPESFWEKSLLEKPRDREVVCHASAWHMDMKDDVRIKMCIEPTEEHFRTIHHELGHIYYYLAYKDLPAIFQSSANDGFHEAVGDTIELSITGKYLKDINLTKSDNQNANAVDLLLPMALRKVAFLPFGLMIDKWRWQVFDGRTTPENYNKGWWELRQKYQGVRAPAERPAEAFDPGAKYHIPGYTPYSRYFLAHILQFQFHRALCQKAGHNGPLHTCSIFNSKQAGGPLWEMLKMGASQPWPVALKAVTGSEKMDATALTEYFAPLEKWLKQQNKGLKCGW